MLVSLHHSPRRQSLDQRIIAAEKDDEEEAQEKASSSRFEDASPEAKNSNKAVRLLLTLRLSQ